MSDLGEQAQVVASVAPKPVLAMVLTVLLHAVIIAGAVAWWLTHPIKPEPLDIELVVVSGGVEIDTGAPPAAPSSNDAPVTQNTAPPVPSTAVEPPVPAPPVLVPPPALALPAPVPPTPVPVAPAVKPTPPKPTPSPAPSLPAAPQTASRPSTSDANSGQPSAGAGGPVGEGDIVKLYTPPPPYPDLARRKGEQGRVIIRAELGTDGLLHNVSVETSSGSKTLDDAAVAGVQVWRFRNNSGRSVDVTAPIVFDLHAGQRRQ